MTQDKLQAEFEYCLSDQTRATAQHGAAKAVGQLLGRRCEVAAESTWEALAGPESSTI